MRRFAWLLWTVLAACSEEDLGRLAEDGTPAGAREGSGLLEVGHQVQVELDRGFGHFTVTRTFHNQSDSEVLEVGETIGLPPDGIATALRVGTGGGWREGTLGDADASRERYDALMEPGEAAPLQAALLEWRGAGEVSLDAWPVLPGAAMVLQYELRAPASYQRGEWQLDYPRPEGGEVAPTFELSGGLRRQESRLEELDDATRLHVRRPPIAEVEARWAFLPLGPERNLWRLEVDVAGELGPAPVRPNVVFVIDASHTEGPEGIEAQLELVRGYLSNAPDAQVELVLFRRFAEQLFGRFVAAADVSSLLQAVPAKRWAPGNGSNLDEGAALAANLLSRTPGPARVVLFTDDLGPPGLDGARLGAALGEAPPGSVVHLVLRAAADSGDGLTERRLLDHRFEPVASAHGGVVLSMEGRASGPAELSLLTLGLVRPIRIDAFEVQAAGMLMDRIDAPELMEEGVALRQGALAERVPPTVTLKGKIWARDFVRVLYLDPDLAERLPALAIGADELRDQLDPAELTAAATAARAVSPNTSYLASAPEAAASTLGRLYGFMSHCFGMSTRSHCGLRCGIPETVVTGRYDHLGALRELITPLAGECARRLGATEAQLSVGLETTFDEIVAVQASGAPSPELAACVAEAVWALRLGSHFNRAHASYQVSIGR